MKRNLALKQKIFLCLIIAILIICVGFIFISCGNGPQSKIANPDKGAFALDFTNCENANGCSALIGVDSRSIANKDITIEASVKSKAATASAFDGAIFGRFDTSGIMLYVKDGEPKAAIRRVGATGTATATADYIVSSGIQILDNAWHHIAAVLTAEDHSTLHADCGATDTDNKTDTVNCPLSGTICNNGIHLDIYVDGEYKECNTTFGENNDTAVTQPAYAGDPFGESASVGFFAEVSLSESLDGLNNVKFPGVIDEARLWGVARTQSQIDQCRSQELTLDSGVCGRITPNCMIYLRFNEGAGETINDWCGLGTGVLAPDWTNGWTTDTPGIDRND